MLLKRVQVDDLNSKFLKNYWINSDKWLLLVVADAVLRAMAVNREKNGELKIKLFFRQGLMGLMELKTKEKKSCT